MGSGYSSPLNTNKSTCANPISSDCVKWVGEPVPALGICTGDTITEVDKAVIDQLLLMLDGTGIVLSQVTLDNCPYLLSLFMGKDKTITNLMQLLIDTGCTYKALIDELFIRTQGSTTQFNLQCLDPITDPTLDKIVQSVINKLCEQQTQIDNINAGAGDTTLINNVVNDSLAGLITSNGNKGIKKTTDSNGLTHYHIFGMPIPGAYLPYGGPLNVFDGTGKGIVGTVAEGWFLCNGSNGTIDMRGFTPVGAIQGVPGGALNPIVDPASDASMNYALGAVGGMAKVQLTQANLPNYTMVSNSFTITSNFQMYRKYTRFQTSSSQARVYGPDASGGDPQLVTLSATSSSGTVSTNLGGSNTAHENRMPYRALNWITRFD